MKQNIILSTVVVSMLISTLHAGGEITPEAPKLKAQPFIKDINGYIRGAYQSNHDNAKDVALGGKLHIETTEWYGLSAGASFYTTHAVGNHDGAGVPFFDANNNSYDILGEAYIQAKYGNTTVKAGRQEIDTPYADTDDIGMVPNTFEAYLLTNKDIADTTIVAGYISKMAGVDAAVPQRFTQNGMSDGITTLGITYEGIENLALQGWYYDIKDSGGDRAFSYIDTTYSSELNGMGYELTLQYATQDALAGNTAGDASIFGIAGNIGFESTGLQIGAAYNTTDGTAADNGFGGGPFVTSSEHLTLAEAGADGEALILTGEWDASIAGLKGLTLSAGYLTLTSSNDTESTELDLVANYALNDAFSIDLIYSDVEDKINSNTFENTRLFVNYTF